MSAPGALTVVGVAAALIVRRPDWSTSAVAKALG
jgi:hypothetical protein